MFNKREDSEPILIKKEKFDLSFFKKNIYLVVLGLILLLGTTFSLTFFIQNKKIGEVTLTIGNLTYTITQDRSININNLEMNVPNNEGLLGFSKEIIVTNTSDINSKLEFKINRTSGVPLKGLRYGLYINDVLVDISDMPSDGVIYHSAILGNEQVKAKVVLWLKEDYSTSETTFVGNIQENITLDSMLASTYLNSLDNLNNNYVKFNGNETWRIKGIEDGSLVVTKTEYLNNTFTNSNLFNVSNTLTDDSLVVSMSTDNKAYYLKKTVKIVGGSGTESDPYILENDIDDINDRKIVGYITYNNDGTNLTPRQPIYYGETNYIGNKVNMALLGWSTTSGGDIEYKLGDTFNINSNTTLYAVWPLTASEFLRERKTSQASCISTEPNKSSFYGDIDADVIYYTGNDESCLKNYVWYSGKLWRIVAIYPNGMMKLVTENPMTAITFGSIVTFAGSWMDQWLSQEFLPTLYNNENIVVQNAEWNVKETTANTDPYLLSDSTTINKTVGLLNAFEYDKSGTSSGYLHIGQLWWLITPYSSSNLRYVRGGGTLDSISSSVYALGARPSIVIKSRTIFDTDNYDGTRLSPFHIVGDIEEGKTNELLNTRISGEYVKFNNELYRIVGIENNTTKIVNTSYINNPNSSNTSDTTLGNFGSDVYFDTQSTDMKYWDKYLTDESGWLSTLSDTSLLVQGTYYQGYYTSIRSYKSTICATVNDEISTKDCPTISGTNMTYTGLVGLLRAGEMMSAQQSTLTHISSNSNYKSMWLITPISSSGMRVVSDNGNLLNYSPGSFAYGARPSINLKSETKIIYGSGHVDDPYEVG